uniref:Enoyl reductase (ER) domain-containing protein n=1 Tax=Salix viminalis TaxID=40686 RepID=A0A6N2NAJ9_SALVM
MAGKLMHAVQYSSYGGGAAGLKHVEVPVPCAKGDEILLKLEATSLNPVDWKIQKGMLRPFLPRRFPYIPGILPLFSKSCFFLFLDDCYVLNKQQSGGGLAEFAVAKKSLSVARPPEVSAAELTRLSSTCWVKLDGSVVGHYAVQLAKLGNTHVTATCGARADEFWITKPRWSSSEEPSGKKYDAKLTFSKKQLCAASDSKGRKLKTVIDSKHALSKAEDLGQRLSMVMHWEDLCA